MRVEQEADGGTQHSWPEDRWRSALGPIPVCSQAMLSEPKPQRFYQTLLAGPCLGGCQPCPPPGLSVKTD